MPYDPARHGPRRIVGPGFHEKVWEVVQRIPEGCVATYGDIASVLGSRSVARQVGFAIAALPPRREEDVPWHRVVNSRGEISRRANGRHSPQQKRRLKEEGVLVAKNGQVDGFEEIRAVLDEDGPRM